MRHRYSHSSSQHRALARRQARQLMLVDLENLAGGSGTEQVVDTFWAMCDQFPLHEEDQVVIGASGTNTELAAFELLGERLQWRWKRGSSGADLALIESVDIVHAASCFNTLVIASGDHAFTELALQARRAGMRVHLLLGRGRCAASLWRAADGHTFITTDQTSIMTVAA